MKIEDEMVEALMDAFCAHPLIIPVDKELFVNLLKSIEIPISLENSKRFYIEFPEYSQYSQSFMEGYGRYYSLSIRRILFNNNADNYKLSSIKKVWEYLIKQVRGYSSNVFARDIRLKEKIVKLMFQKAYNNPFSLLAKFETFDFENQDLTLFHSIKPILVIPGVDYGGENGRAILSWEHDNMVYEKEVGLFFRHFKRISQKEYVI